LSTEASYSSVDLAEYGRIVQRRKWLIIGVAVLFGLIGAFYAKSQPRRYATSAEIELPAPAEGSGVTPKALDQDVRTQQQVIKSQVVADRAAIKLGPRSDARKIMRQLKVTAPVDSRVIILRFVDDTAEKAAAGANAFAEAYIELRTEQAQAEVAQKVIGQQATVDDLITRRAAADTEASIALNESIEDNTPANIQKSAAATRRAEDLNREVSEAQQVINTLKATPINGGTVISKAAEPRAPINPGPTRTGMLGFLAGLVVGVGAAFLRDRLDAQVRDTGDIETTLGVSSLGNVPMFSDRYRSRANALVTVHAPDSAEADAFRRLRASVLIAAIDRGTQVLAVTSANPGEGKSTVAANLAVSLAQAGRSVVIISADVRRPALDELFDQRGAAGLGDILEGRADLDDVLITMGEAGLALITSGKIDTNPTDLLQAPRMEQMLEVLRDRYELVIIDTPPVLAVADTVSLVPVTDGVLMVVGLDDTSSDDVADAENQLRRVGAVVLGAIVNRTELEDKRYRAYRESIPDVPPARRNRKRPGPEPRPPFRPQFDEGSPHEAVRDGA
jgi:capsular exopolysaccharide synthesis family protein